MGPTLEQNETLNKQAFIALINRAQIGSFVYPIIWLIIGLSNGLHLSNPDFLYVNAAFFFLVTSARLIYSFLSSEILNNNFNLLKKFYEIMVISQGFHFGILGAIVYHSPEMKSMVFPMLFAGATMVVGGSTSLAINNVIRIFYPLFMVAPFMGYLILNIDKYNSTILGVMIIFIVYHLLVTRNISRDYWTAITNSALLEQRAKELEIKINEVNILSGLLPICASCKKIRDNKGEWTQIETYITKNSDAQFSHGMCSECSDNLYGDQDWYKGRKRKK